MRGVSIGRWVLWAPIVILIVSLTVSAGPLHGQVSQQRIENAARLLKDLVETYGVSGDEGEVRKEVLDALPDWADPEVDSAGNVWVRVGQGEPVSVFVAHMDEVGFQVTEIGDDGRLTVRSRGGFLQSLWEGTPAIVHQEDEPINGVFVPRADTSEPRRFAPAGPTYVDVGARSRAEAEAMGIEVGQTVTNPKEFVRLAGTRATGRSFDDRVGAAAQILALQEMDPATAQHEFVFLWVVEEEIGLVGSAYAARTLGFDADRIYPVDTFVSADTPIDPQNFAVAPIGKGPVVRAVDNSSVTPPAVVDSLVSVVRARGLPFQVGTTNGGNDGSAWSSWGVVDIPFGWPLRYSHSPIEVIDLKDVVVLSDWIRAIVEAW